MNITVNRAERNEIKTLQNQKTALNSLISDYQIFGTHDSIISNIF